MTRQVEDVRGSGVGPATRSYPPGGAIASAPAVLGPEERTRAVPIATVEKAALLAGRSIFGGYFLYNGINHFLNYSMMTGYARSKGVPAAAVAVPASGLFIVLGGLSMLTGAWPKMGAGLITAFLLGVSPQMHAFWKEQQPETRMQEMVNFTKNMALVGASLMAAAHPEPWPWRLRTRAEAGMLSAGS